MYLHNSVLAQWYQASLGKRLFQVEQNLLIRTLLGATGRVFLYWSNQDIYQLESRIYFEEHIYLSVEADFPLFARGVQVDPYALPFLTESIDVVLLPHIIEFLPDPFTLLRESCRILKPGGRLVILNFNPVSLWGIGKWMHKKDQFPWNGKSISALFLRCFFGRLGLSVVEYKTDFFRPLFSKGPVLEQYAFLETVGQLCWPFLGAIYMMVVQKESEETIKINAMHRSLSDMSIRRQPEPSTNLKI